MIEVLRFLLSCIVVQSHLWLPATSWLAWQSVFGFYTLSGFLIVRVLHERYGFGRRNFAAFALNRVLRLWPAYLSILGITMAALPLIPGVSAIHPKLQLPHGAGEAVANVTILGLTGVDIEHMAHTARLVPTSWSLSIELFCYVLLGIYFGKTERRLLALGLIGVAALAWSTDNCIQAGDTVEYATYCFQNRYGVLQAGLIPFAAGGILYFRAREARSFLVGRWGWVAVILGAIELPVAVIPALQYTAGPFIGSLVVGAVIVRSVRDARITGPAAFLGRASYHLFIGQWVIAAILAATTPLTLGSLGLTLGTLALSLGLSCALIPLERRVERIRRRVGDAAGGVFPGAIAPATSGGTRAVRAMETKP